MLGSGVYFGIRNISYFTPSYNPGGSHIMNIQAIGTYPLYATRPYRKKVKKKSTGVSDLKGPAKSDEGIFLSPNAITNEDGDFDSSQRWFTAKESDIEVGEGFDDVSFVAHLKQAEKIEDFYHFDSRNSIYKSPVYQSYKNISLPEALIFYTLIHHPKESVVTAMLVVKENALVRPVVQLSLTIKLDSRTIVYDLHYCLKNRKVDMYQEGKDVGRVRYRIRGHKIEEIEGTLHNSLFRLDPVWHPSQKGELREETFAYDSQVLRLVYAHNETYSIGSPTQVSIKADDIKKLRTKSVVRKKVRCMDYKGEAQVLYVKGILIPFFGQWNFYKET